MNAKRLGDIQEVGNTNKHWAANSKYNFIRVQRPDGVEVPLLFTDSEICRAAERAAKNPEDLPKTSVLRNLFD